jgi:predicted phage-related endonuclease
MGSNEIRNKVYELRELRRMAEELSAEIETLQDAIKAHMDTAGVDTIAGVDYKVTYKSVTSSRFDSTAFRKDNPEIAAAYMKTTTTRRFTVA